MNLTLKGRVVVDPFTTRDALHVVQGRCSPVSGTDATVVDMGDAWILPGFVDLHLHGGGGADIGSGEGGGVDVALEWHLKRGTTTALATIASVDLSRYLSLLATTPRSRAFGGWHIEGPFLNVERRGISEAASLMVPADDVAEKLVAAAQGRLRMVTLAPELPGARSVAALMAQAGVVVAAGHSDATWEEMSASRREGWVAHATHLYNGMRPPHHRDPGIVTAVLNHPGTTCDLVVDGHHVHPAIVRMVVAAMGVERVAAITDASALAGTSDSGTLGSVQVHPEGTSVRDGNGALAGSAISLLDGARWLRTCGFSLAQIVAMTSTTPARISHMKDRGTLLPGARADCVVLDDEMGLQGVMVEGEWVCSPP